MTRTILTVLAALVGSVLLSSCDSPPEALPDLDGFSEDGAAYQAAVEQRIRGRSSPDRISGDHRALTGAPHHAATEANDQAARYIAERLEEMGFDSVRFFQYHVPLPRPLERRVALVAPSQLELDLVEPPLETDPDTRSDDVLPPFNAFSPDGDAAGEVVYVNYGTAEDYAVLDSLGISVEGRIVLARYGRGWRGIKPRLAAERGAVGALLYSDPEDDGFTRGEVMPDGPWRPSFGVQRGSVLDIPLYPGDPQTPGRPSTEGVLRVPMDSAATLVAIPVQPLSYGAAEPILAALGGTVAPPDWQGGLDLAYHIGPGPSRVEMRLRFDWSIRPITNVVGYLTGSKEPDQVVMAGGHRDAWTFGGRDPMSGAASLLETARLLSDAARRGHPPKRTIAIASWDAEEYGLIGSTEFGEEWAEELSSRLVAYVNRESYTAGDFSAAGSHALATVLNAVTRQVASPEGGDSTVWDRWQAGEEDGTGSGSGGDVSIGALGSGSDYTVFLDHLGVPSLNLGFASDNGIYHSRYDTRDFFVRFGDPGFRHGAALSEVVGLLLARLANADILPYDYTVTARAIGGYLEELEREARRAGIPLDLSGPRDEARTLGYSAGGLSTELDRIFRSFSPDELASFRLVFAAINAELISVERAFLHAEGLPGRPWYKHQLYAPGYQTGYGAKTLPGIREAVEAGDARTAQAMADVLTDRLREANDRLRRALLHARGVLPPLG